MAGGRRGGVRELGVPPDRVCALTTERATICGVEMTKNEWSSPTLKRNCPTRGNEANPAV